MKTLLCILCLFAVPSIFAQGFFVHQGLGLEVGFSSINDFSILSASAGYVLNGVVEFGLDVKWSSSDENDTTVLGVGPFVGVYPVHQSDTFPLTIRLGAAYEMDSFGGATYDAFEELLGTASASVWSVGGAIAHTASVSPTVYLVPIARLSYTSLTQEFSDVPPEITFEGKSDFETISVELGIVIQRPNASFVYVTPSLGLADGDAVFGVEVGFILAASKR